MQFTPLHDRVLTVPLHRRSVRRRGRLGAGGRALAAGGARAQLVGLALERRIVVAGAALPLRGRADPALALLHHVRELVTDQLEAAGLLFYRMGRDTIRLVTSWQTTPEDVDTALAAFESALA